MKTRLTLAALAVAGVLAIAARAPETRAQQAQPPAAPPPAPVEIALAESSDFAPVQWVPGSVVSREDSRIASEQSGRVRFVAEVGDRIAAGGMLARLDDEALRLTEQTDLATVRRIETQLAYAERQAERLAQLRAQSSIAETQLDQAESERDTLAQDLVRARAALDETRRRIREATVRAPFDGVVAERHTQVGEFLAAGSPVVRLVNTEALEVRAQAPVALAGKLASGHAVTLREGEERAHEAIRAVVPVGDAQSRQLEVRIGLTASSWPIGSAVQVALPVGEVKEVVAVPRDALILRADETYVFRLGPDNTAERVVVRTGEANGNLIEVDGELAAGDRLVVRGGERLRDGQPVAIRERS